LGVGTIEQGDLSTWEAVAYQLTCLRMENQMLL
jgi:hypothetical protein